MPDPQTVQAYSAQADELAAQYRRVLPPFLPRIVAVARPGGSLLDVGCGSGLDPQHRSPEGRLFTPILPEQVRALIQRAGFRLLSEQQTQDSMGRPDIQWVSMLAKSTVIRRQSQRWYG